MNIKSYLISIVKLIKVLYYNISNTLNNLLLLVLLKGNLK